MPRITISYRREDSGVITGRIFDRLVAQYGREAIFRDIDDVPFGVDFREHISRVLDESDVVLAIVGPRWLGPRGAQNRLNNEADPVRVEIEIALRNGVPLIPVLVLRAQMPQAAQLPDSLRDFAYRNALQIDAQQDFDVHMTRLLRAMDAILARAAEAAAAREAEAAAARAAEAAAAREAETAAAREAEAAAAREAETAAAREVEAAAAREAEAAAAREAEAAAAREAEAAAAREATAAREAEARAAREAEATLAREAIAASAREAEAAATRAAEAAARAAEAAASRAADSAAAPASEPPTRRPLLIGASIVAALGIAAAGWYLALDRQKSPLPTDTAAAVPNAALPPAISPPSTPPSTPGAAPIAAPAPPAIDPELLFWQSIANNGTQADFEEYLNKYPQGQFVGLARNRIAALQAPPPVTPIAPPAVAAPQAPAEGEAGWTIEEKREVQRALRTLGHYQGEPDGGFGTGTRAAIKEFREFSGSAETGEMNEAERKSLVAMAQRLAVLLDQPASSPQGMAAASIKGAAQRYARAWNFENAKGVKADPAEAAYWYALAAGDGDAKAFTNLGTLVARGWDGTKPDPVAAGLLWWVAAARGEAIAMFDQGVLYERGIGVTADLARAKAWYERAAAHNHPGARDALKRLGP